MTDCFLGFDFGTTNSSVAACRDGRVEVLNLDAKNDNPASLPSLLYIPKEGKHLVGREAANAFIERNVGREVLSEKVQLDVDYDGYVGSEPDRSAYYRPPDEIIDRREAVQAQVTIEVNSPGRLFQSLKSSLRYREHKGTYVFGRHYQIEELTAMILAPMKRAADAAAGKPVERAVFGRPVRFAHTDEEDATAERRLRVAASLAGIKDAVFFYEPVAACVEYAVAADRTQRLMVVDVGGGTCDVCVMEFGGGGGTATRLADSRILGVSGVPVAGDAIDRELIREKLLPFFGSESRYGPAQLPMPQHIYSAIVDWQKLYKLNTEEIVNWLVAAEMSSTDPKGMRALRHVIQRNYGYPVVREAELAKKRLSFDTETPVRIQHGPIDVDEVIQRAEFTHIIEHTLDTMMDAIKEAEAAAGVGTDGIDYVLTTGGTSLIPAVRAMLAERYGEDKLVHRETFTSVAAGLALVAQFV